MNYFTLKQGFFLYSSDIPLEEMKKIECFLSFLEESGVAIIIKNATIKENYQGRKKYDRYNLFATILYAFSKNINSLREIEYACKVRIDFMYLMEKETPSHVVFSEFINNIILPNINEIFKLLTIQAIKIMNISLNDVYLDGSKFEANANKYKFVYKPRKNLYNLSSKINEISKEYEISFRKDISTLSEVLSLITFIKNKIGDKEVISGKGKKLTKDERSYIKLQKYLYKLEEYEEKIRICGDDRNSYYKTDHDATAMCLKEDYYSGLGSNMHAAYNVQFVVSKGIIVVIYVSQDRNDYYTLIPTIEHFYSIYKCYPQNLCADSGYGSYQNYKYLKEKNINSYVKYPSWKKEREGESPQLFHYVDKKIICLNGKIGEVITISDRHPKNRQGKIYKFTGCLRCKYKQICKKTLKKKTGNIRISEINPEYLIFIEESRKNLLSPKGIEMRINRSIQVEGDFGIIKQDLSYSRFKRRKIKKVTMEITLVVLGLTIRKLFKYIETGKLPEFWKAPSDLQSEKEKEIKLKPKRKAKKTSNQKAKSEYKYTRKKRVK